MRKYVSPKIIRSIYFATFDSYLFYCCLAWARNFNTIQWIVILQKKTIRIINFWPRNFHTSPLFKQNSILKFQDKICLENISFVSKSLNNLSPSIFNTSVTYPGRLGARYTGLGTQTLAPKKSFLTFYLKIFFKHPQRRVFRYSIDAI